ATGPHQVTDYEKAVLAAAARAHQATGAPITTHTDEGSMGREQVAILTENGVDPAHIIVGHSCGNADLRYHVDLLDRGVTLGFDAERQIVLSHDTVWCWRGRGMPVDPAVLAPHWDPRHVLQRIVPALRDAGVSQAKIDAMLIDNPRRYLAGEG